MSQLFIWELRSNSFCNSNFRPRFPSKWSQLIFHMETILLQHGGGSLWSLCKSL
uniref:Uncharacterized protein n=1 Tax=Arundo donax TaxID=35708 RepID=A0A0A9C2I3_ARUDO